MVKFSWVQEPIKDALSKYIKYSNYQDDIQVTFSIGSHVLSKYRNTILLKSFQGHIYAYNWLF